jgi:alanyl-tRNA synthetase
MVDAMVTKDVVEKGVNASTIVSEIAKIIGGGGGGRPESAQAGGRYPDKLAEALSLVPDIVSKSLKES